MRWDAPGADIIEGINWIISQEWGHTDSAVLSMSLGMPSSGFYAGDQVSHEFCSEQ